MPGYNCSIKERMLYSSCKNPFTDSITGLGLEITKKVCAIFALIYMETKTKKIFAAGKVIFLHIY